MAGDAAEESTAAAVVALAEERFGPVDVLVNNAGQGSYKAFVETTVAEYDAMMAANVRSGFVFSRAVVPRMVERGSGVILFVSSVAGMAGGGEGVGVLREQVCAGGDGTGARCGAAGEGDQGGGGGVRGG